MPKVRTKLDAFLRREREVSFKGKQSLSGPAWEASKTIAKVSTKLDAFLGEKTLFRILVSKGPEREVSFKGKQSLSGPAWGVSKNNTKSQY